MCITMPATSFCSWLRLACTELSAFNPAACRLQLVYACGAQAALPAMEQRTAAAQALMHAIADMADSGSRILNQPGVAVWVPPSDPSRCVVLDPSLLNCVKQLLLARCVE